MDGNTREAIALSMQVNEIKRAERVREEHDAAIQLVTELMEDYEYDRRLWDLKQLIVWGWGR